MSMRVRRNWLPAASMVVSTSVPANPPAMARNAGLLPGDLIERFDGATVGDPARDRQMLAAAALAGGTRIGVVRGRRRITLYMPIR